MKVEPTRAEATIAGASNQIRDAEEKDDNFVADDRRPLIPEGEYHVSCIRIEKGIAHFRSLKLFVHFKIVDPGEFMGTELFMSVNLINSRTGKPFRKVPPGSKYYSQWVIANKNRQPSRNDRMSHKIFLNGIFEAVVRTVKPKFPDGTAQPDCFHYSIVDYLKERIS